MEYNNLKNMMSLMRKLKRSTSALLTNKLAEYDLTYEQWVVLRTVMEHQPITQKLVGELTGKDRSTMTRILDQLENKKMLERNKAVSDRRLFDLGITAKGSLIFEEMIPVEKEMYTKMCEGISDEEFIGFNLILTRFIDNVNDYQKKEV